MSYDQSSKRLPAPCIVDTGIVVNKLDMRRLLMDLRHVRYLHLLEGDIQTQGEGYVLEVFTDPQRSTLVANHALYLNVDSFDYLELRMSGEGESYLDLVQDHRRLRLIPLTNLLQDHSSANLNAADLEAVVDQVLSAKWDLQIDDEGEDTF